MRIRSVTARAFGPLTNETLSFAEGLTVVVGPNEAGKTSWHAAVRAGVCGVKRGRGRPTVAEEQFAALHRPWDAPGAWAVEVRLALDDGREVELRQDLAGKVDSGARDLVLGSDISAEIMHDGAPDASRWLGLTRDAFAATICVDQADILGVVDAASRLQDHLQRAAATHGTDATASQAIEGLERFRSDAVGLDRSNSTKPLRRAKEAVEAADAAVGGPGRATRTTSPECSRRTAPAPLQLRPATGSRGPSVQSPACAQRSSRAHWSVPGSWPTATRSSPRVPVNERTLQTRWPQRSTPGARGPPRRP